MKYIKHLSECFYNGCVKECKNYCYLNNIELYEIFDYFIKHQLTDDIVAIKMNIEDLEELSVKYVNIIDRTTHQELIDNHIFGTIYNKTLFLDLDMPRNIIKVCTDEIENLFIYHKITWKFLDSSWQPKEKFKGEFDGWVIKNEQVQ